MRLSDKERRAIKSAVRRRFGTDARVMLFGSRTDDSRRGGDIDLVVSPLTDPNSLIRREIEHEAVPL